MRIINVLTIVMGIPSKLISFPIHEEQESEKIIEEAQKIFKVMVKEFDKTVDEDELDECVDEDLWEGDGYEVHLIWSET